MPEEPNRGRSNVSKLLVSNLSFFNWDFSSFYLWLFCSSFSSWLLWFCTPPPKPPPTSRAPHHHPHQLASAAGVLTGRASKKKALPPVVQHHPQCLFQEMTLHCWLCTKSNRPWRHKEHFISVNKFCSVPEVLRHICLFVVHGSCVHNNEMLLIKLNRPHPVLLTVDVFVLMMSFGFSFHKGWTLFAVSLSALSTQNSQRMTHLPS